MTEPAKLLELRGVRVRYEDRGGGTDAVRDVDLALRRGEVLGLVGESGSGKSTLAAAALRYLPARARLAAGEILFDGRDLYAFTQSELRAFWRRRARLVPQDPLPSLNPSQRVGRQVAEALVGEESGRRVLELFESVGLADPERIARAYPFQLSGGQQQRVMIAMALGGDPDLLVLDEPTTNLDVTTEAAVLDLVRELIRERGTAVLFVSHNLAVVAGLCDRVAVLRSGELVEEAPVREVLGRPRHPYTRQLLASVPRIGQHRRGEQRPPGPAGDRAGGKGLELRDLEKSYPLGRPLLQALRRVPRRHVRALAGVDLEVEPGRTLGLVGESGSGKSTLARAVVGLAPATGGEMRLDGEPLPPALEKRDAATLGAVQMVFQSSDEALNPFLTVGEALRRPLRKLAGLSRRDADAGVAELLEAVSLPARYAVRLPEQLSGGEKQRVAIARAFAARPEVLLFDESVSGLDVSVQADILELLGRLQDERGSGYLFISHDLAVVSFLADDIAVIYLGRLMQVGRAREVLEPPYHPYTEALLSAVPVLDPDSRRGTVRLEGEVPSPVDVPGGCPFHTRCPRKLGPICEERFPPAQDDGRGGRIHCHKPLAELAAEQERIFTFEPGAAPDDTPPSGPDGGEAAGG